MRASPLTVRDLDLVGLALGGRGRVALVTTTGRITGLPRTVAVGFVPEPDGTILVSAMDAATAWGRNLRAHPICQVVIGERQFEAWAELLERPDHIHTVRELILRYGTPSEGLGRGPSFRLRPVVGGAT